MSIIPRMPKIFNITLTTAGVEQPVILIDTPVSETAPQPNIRTIQIQSRDNLDLKYAWVSAAEYFTLKAGRVYYQDRMDCPLLTLYLTGTSDGQVAEVEVWY